MSDASQAFKVTDDPAYYANERADLVALLPRPLGRVLDVGCAAGGVGRSLRAAGATKLVGIELNERAAEQAREVFDEVLTADAESLVATGELTGPFDTVVLYDVLEHLVDPAKLLAAIQPLVVPGGHVHVSMPNARHFSLIRDLVVRGTFGYSDWGHRDRTHLRWFTRKDAVALLTDGGWTVERVEPTLPGRSGQADRLTRGAAREFIALQWTVLARR